MRVLITGANGFIGRHCLLPLLSSGFEVHAVDIRVPHRKAGDVHWHQVDLMDAKRVTETLSVLQPTHLLHFAWFVKPGEYWTSLENLSWVQASLSLLQAFARSGGQRAVIAGTCAEYDWRYGYCSELVTPLSPVTLYGTCKHALHLMSEALAKQDGLSLAWGRVFSLYGPYEPPNRLVSSVIRSLLQGKPALCSHGRQIRDLLHVEDVAGAFVALLQSVAEGGVNVASGVPIPLREVICKIAESLGRHELVQLGAIPAAVNEPPFLVADIRRLAGEVGWQPKYGLQTGLEHTIDWWKGQLAEAGGVPLHRVD